MTYCTRLFLLSLISWGMLQAAPASAEPGQWDGWNAGLQVGRQTHRVNTTYAHQHTFNCVNLNFGSEWPGDGCEGNQDYSAQMPGRKSLTQVGLFAERLWPMDGQVMGVHLGIQPGAVTAISDHRVLSRTWGDTLDVGLKVKESVNLQWLFGVPTHDWLPFVGLGLVLQKTALDMQQDQKGYNLAVTQSQERWAWGTLISMGVKKQIARRWTLTAEFLHQNIHPTQLNVEGVLKAGGLRYPDTRIQTQLDSTAFRLGIGHRF